MASVVRVDERRNGRRERGSRMSKYSCDKCLDHSRDREDFIGQIWLVSSHSLHSMNQPILLAYP